MTEADGAVDIDARHWISEPYWDGSTWRVEVRAYFAKPAQGAPRQIIRTNVQAIKFCSATRTGSAAAQAVTNFNSGNFSDNSSSPLDKDVSLGACPSSTPYLVAIQLKDLTSGSFNTATARVAELWWYSGAARAGGVKWPADKAWCDVVKPESGFSNCATAGGGQGGGGGGEWADAPQDVYDDAANFDLACADPPAAEWLSFGWLGPWVGHYVNCLFDPGAGFRLAPVETALHDSFVGDLQDFGDGLSDLSFTGKCGVLFTATPSPLLGQGLTVDTCSTWWNSFPVVRTVLGIGVAVGAALLSSNLLVGAIGLKYFGMKE